MLKPLKLLSLRKSFLHKKTLTNLSIFNSSISSFKTFGPIFSTSSIDKVIDEDVCLDENIEEEVISSIKESDKPEPIKVFFNGKEIPTNPYDLPPIKVLPYVDIVTSKLEGDIPVSFDDIEHVFKSNKVKLDHSCGTVEELPEPSEKMPQIVFAGRSNVGKSSLLNAVLGSTYAKVSSTPGHTKRVNFFNLSDCLYLVDIPGYGHAEGNKEKIEDFNVLLREYCTTSSVIKRVFILIDSRHGIYEEDCAFMDLLEKYGVSYQLVLTKCDKVTHEHLCELMKLIYDNIHVFGTCFPIIIPTSSERQLGILDLRANIIKASGLLESGALFTEKQRIELTRRMENKLFEKDPDHPYFQKRDEILEMMQEREKALDKITKKENGNLEEKKTVDELTATNKKEKKDLQLEKKINQLKEKKSKQKKKVNLVGLE
ncbi:hypothetical protein ABK040_012670 [Willaertia magna]